MRVSEARGLLKVSAPQKTLEGRASITSAVGKAAACVEITGNPKMRSIEISGK